MRSDTNGIELVRRFWAKVGEMDERGCWPWIGAKSGQGYGYLKMQGKLTLAHRLSYRMRFGRIGREKEIAHRCDVPACVRPAHLFEATHAENMQDAARKGRLGKKRA